jgi:chitinase
MLWALFGLLSLALADTYCDANTACEIGCCGEYNVCGMGPTYCSAKTCINNCDAKAECNPDNWPEQYVNATTCPLNVCCSSFGFCGTTEEFCGNTTVTRPSCDADAQSINRVIGYYNSAAASRGCGGMQPASISQGVYSHIYFAFVSIDPDSFEVIPASNADKLLYPQMQALQMRDLSQELWLSIGGWDFSDSGAATATTFSDLVGASTSKQNAFFKSLTQFMTTYGFTGIDIDWEYPAAGDRNGRDSDYANFPTFLARLRKALDDYKFGLSITLPTSYWYLQHFDLESIDPSVDWFNFMSYDLHGTWDIGNEWTGAYLNAHTNLTEIKTALDLLWRNDIKPSKVNMGMAFYGRSFTLASSSCTEPGCPYLSTGDAGDCSDTAGVLFNSEIEAIISDNDLTPKLYKDAAIKAINWNSDQWVSYDDEDTWKLKAELAKSQCLGGVLVWSVDSDDSSHTFSKGLAAALGNEINLNTTTGLTSATFLLEKSATITSTSTPSQGSYCRFINCGDVCPSGYKVITREDKTSQLMLDSTECPSGYGQTQTLCCPSSSDLPTCQWRGFHNNGKCKGGCDDGEAEVGTTGAGCTKSGYQSACCSTTTSTDPWSKCAWTTSCESDKTCPSGFSNFVVGSRNGWGGMPSCKGDKTYNYCCSGSSVPDAFTNCEWKGHETTFVNTAYCSDSCPSGYIRVAEQSINMFFGNNMKGHTTDCIAGNEAYCCKGATAKVAPRSDTSEPTTYQDQTAKDFDAYLKKFLADPVCPLTWEAQYSATFGDDYVTRRSMNYVNSINGSSSSSTGFSVGKARRDLADQATTLSLLMPLLQSWITSEVPREDINRIWDLRLEEYGLENDAANSSTMRNVLFGSVDSWSGSFLYSPSSTLSDELCNIADSSQGLDRLYVASEYLCDDPSEDDDDSTLSTRTVTVVGTDTRSENNCSPSVMYVLRGIINVILPLSHFSYSKN